jgi:hypothetical protein
MKNLCKPSSTDDTFWISLNDYFDNFAGVNCVKIEEWNEARFPGKFIRVKSATDASNDIVLSNYYYEVTFASDSNSVVSIYQENQLTNGADLFRQPIEMNYIILQRDEDGDLALYDYIDYSKVESQWKDVYFNAGTYIIVPSTLGCYL